VANVVALRVNDDGSLSQLQDGDDLLVDNIERKASSGNLVIGSLLGAVELQLGSISSEVAVLGDLSVDGEVVGDLSIGSGNLISSRLIGHDAEHNEGNSGTAIAFSFDTYQNVRVTMNGNCTATLDSPPAGVTGKFQIKVLTGAGGYTLSFSTSIFWINDDTYVATTTASKVDFVNLYWDGSQWWGQYSKNFPTS